MSNIGFGNYYFGEMPFGHIDWARIVLWEELPEEAKIKDKEAGYPYRDFVFSVCPSFEWLKKNVDRFKNLDDHNKIRLNLLQYLASNFGIDLDIEQPEEYQRMRVQVAGKWNVIKGTVSSYYVICGVYGFDVDVVKLWWNGTSFSENSPYIFTEIPEYDVEISGLFKNISIWLKNAPIVPGTLEIDIDGTILYDDGDGGISGYVGSIDYGWGYVRINLFPGSTSSISVNYRSKVGGCIDNGGEKCLTHKLRLIITPGDIAGQDDITISEAFKRLWQKLEDEVRPIHVEFEPIKYIGSGYLSVGNRYDVIPADDVIVDTGFTVELL